MSVYMTIELEVIGKANLPPDMNPNDEFVYGQGFTRYLEKLDPICQKIGLQSLRKFCYAVCDENQPKWHNPSEALQIVRGLRTYLNENPTAIDKPYEYEWMLWDLEAYERILTAAEQEGTLFYFKVC